MKKFSSLNSRLISKSKFQKRFYGSKEHRKYETGTWLDKYAFTTQMKFNDWQTEDLIPIYQVMDFEGKIIDKSQDPKLDKETVVKMYKTIVELDTMDTILYDIQRQGRISFYMTNYGEAATHIGSAAALTMEDVVYGQYREAGVLLWRGFTLPEFLNQCYSNNGDYGKGRQMPVHYGKASLNFQTISSPLGTQIPQASGSAYALKMMGKKACTMVYFGEGAASEGDFHAALNFAATLECPTIFFCRNNGYAISTPIEEQYKGDGIASRGYGYGVDTIRVDGNDMWAVFNATSTARKMAIEKNKPVLIEAMTYRISHHSTSDDSSRYRNIEEVNKFKSSNNPLLRLKNYMIHSKVWEDSLDDYHKIVRENVKKELLIAEEMKKPSIENMFTDVFDDLLPHLKEQYAHMKRHIDIYSDEYKEHLDIMEKK